MAYKAFLVAANLNEDSSFIPLPNTLNDVREIKRLLTERPSYFKPEHLQEYTGNIVRNRVISAALQDFFETANNEDIIILFWAGHGHLFNGEGYLVPADGQSSNVINTMIKMSEVREWINNSNAKVVISLIDTCHSGSIARNQAMLRGLEISGSGKAIIAACQTSQSAYDRGGHGAFTDYLIQGLSGEAANRDGIIDIYTLYSFITNKLSNEYDDQVPVITTSTLNGSPIEIKRVVNREQQVDVQSTEEVGSSGRSYWLGSITHEYDSFTEVSQNSFKMNLFNPPPAMENEIRKLNRDKNTVPFAVRNQASLVKVKDLNIISESSGDKLEVYLEKVEGNHTSSMPGAGFGGGNGKTYSDNEIAELRAKRILLIEKHTNQTNMLEGVGDLLLETLITRPMNASLREVDTDLLERLFNQGVSPTRIRVITVGFLILSGTVDHIERLSYQLENGKVKKVEFIGVRKKFYINEEAYRIEVSGEVLI
jgi:hypothetical protein